MININYPQCVIDRAEEICADVEKRVRSVEDRDKICQEEVGLTYRYLKQIGKRHKKPSNRVLLNLGFAMKIVTPNGEEHFVNLEENSPWDWNTHGPRMRASSTESSAS